MNKLYLFLFFTLYIPAVYAQATTTVGGQCIAGSIVLNQITDVDGKIAFEGFGTVDGNAGVQVDVFWMPAPDNVWVIAFDGQPYFQNSCNSTAPSNTGNALCPWSGVSGQTCTGGSPLAVLVTGVLPVTITSFSAKVDSRQVALSWGTASEINNKGFEIQRSIDGATWTAIGFVAGNNNSNIARTYHFNDINPVSGKVFYRLRQVDEDGRFNYSSTVSAQFLKSDFYSIVRLAGNGRYQLDLVSGNEKIDISVFDAGGRSLMLKTAIAGVQYIDVSKFPSGIYLLHITKGTKTFTEKLIKF